MSFLLVASCEASLADVAAERLLTRVCAHVRRQVVAAAERAEADAALERLLSGVDSDVTRELIGSRETSVAVLNRTCVLALVHRNLALTWLTLAWFWLEQFSRRDASLHHLSVENALSSRAARFACRRETHIVAVHRFLLDT